MSRRIVLTITAVACGLIASVAMNAALAHRLPVRARL
jgi:hypothetical protein